MNTEFFHGEYHMATGAVPNPNAIRVRLNPELRFHRVYFYLEGLLSADGDYHIEGVLRFFHNNSPVGELPASIARDNAATNLLESVATCFTATTLIAADVLKVDLMKKLGTAGKTEVILVPTHVQIQADEAIWELKALRGFGGITVNGCRAYLGIRSHGQPT